jgi:hypothetical protein
MPKSGAGSPPSEVATANALQFRIGAQVCCSDGVCGDLRRVVIDPVARTLTHLVVEPKRRHGLGRLVPIELVDRNGKQVHLRCRRARFDQLDDAEETQFLPVSSYAWGYGTGQVSSWPYYGLVADGGGVSGGSGLENAPHAIVSDRGPLGEVEVRRGDKVYARDGGIGSVQGLVVDPRDHHVTHVLLQEGHLWDRQQVTVPIGAVTSVLDGIHVKLTKQEVHDLPPVNLRMSP